MAVTHCVSIPYESAKQWLIVENPNYRRNKHLFRQSMLDWLNHHAGRQGWDYAGFHNTIHVWFNDPKCAMLFKLVWM